MDKPTKTAKRRDRRSFTPEFKAEVVRLCRAGVHSAINSGRPVALRQALGQARVKHRSIRSISSWRRARNVDSRSDFGSLL